MKFDCPNCGNLIARDHGSLQCKNCGYVPRHGAD